MSKTITLDEHQFNVLKAEIKKSLFKEFQDSIRDIPFNDPIECPCCKGTVTLYKRNLNLGQVYFLIELFNAYKRTGVVWHRFNDIQKVVEQKYNKRCTDYTKLKDFGLIKSKGDVTSDGNSSGYFACTRNGALFIEGKQEVPSYLKQDNHGNTLSESLHKVTINHFFKRFDFNELILGHKQAA